MIQILELFGGIGSPRCALRNIGIPVKAIDYVEIDEKAVRSYNAMFADELPYKTQSVVGWNLKPDILIHGSPCQDFSIAGHQGKATAEAGRINRGKGADKGSGTRSSLMWETIHIIEQMGEWKPKYVIWENVKNVLSRYMRVNFNLYLSEMERLGYSSNFEILDAREFGLPQAKAAITELKRQEKQERKKEKYHNTFTLMKCYRDAVFHIENAISDGQQLELKGMTDEQQRTYLESIRRTRFKTLIMTAHIDKAVEEIERRREAAGRGVEYKAFEMYFMQGMDYAEIAEELDTGKNTPRRWVTGIINELSVLLWGIDEERVK